MFNIKRSSRQATPIPLDIKLLRKLRTEILNDPTGVLTISSPPNVFGLSKEDIEIINVGKRRVRSKKL